MMLATTKTKKEITWGTDLESGWATYIPSHMLLYLILENGWKIVKVELASTEDQSGFVYLVTLNSGSHQECQQLILPKIALIEKMLFEHQDTNITANEKNPSRKMLPTM